MKYIKYLIAASLLVLASCQKQNPVTPDPVVKSFEQDLLEMFEFAKKDYPAGTETELWSIVITLDRAVTDPQATPVPVKVQMTMGVGPYMQKDGKSIVITKDYKTGKMTQQVAEIPVVEYSQISLVNAITLADALTIFRTQNGKMSHNGRRFDVPESKVISICLPLGLAAIDHYHHARYAILNPEKTLMYGIDVTDGYTDVIDL